MALLSIVVTNLSPIHLRIECSNSKISADKAICMYVCICGIDGVDISKCGAKEKIILMTEFVFLGDGSSDQLSYTG